MQRLGEVSDDKVPAKATIVSGCMILFSPLISRRIPGISSAFVLFASAASAVVVFIYVLTMLAHRRYRQSADFLPDGFVMPAWQVCDWIAIAFYVFVYVTLFLSADTRGSAIAGLLWLVVFGGDAPAARAIPEPRFESGSREVDVLPVAAVCVACACCATCRASDERGPVETLRKCAFPPTLVV